jgi:hypothetical protein
MNSSQVNDDPFNGSKYLILLNSYGQTVTNKNLQPGISDYFINTSHLSEGLYFLKIGNEMQKVVIQH